MIILDNEIRKANRAAQIIVWRYRTRWMTEDLKLFGIDETQLTDNERLELMEQLHKQDRRIRGLFGI
jgi:hypothetical protein